ncbi:MAG: plasmid stabilization protein [Gemmatimonadales bacterium]
MPRGDKSAYTDRQKRKAEHIEEGYEKRGVSGGEAARRAWATVNKEEGGGKKSGSGRGKKSTKRSKSSRSAAAKKGAARRRSKSTAGRKGPSTRSRKSATRGRKSASGRSRKSAKR